jgi:hypothetical protein
MRNRKNIIRNIALGIVALVLLSMTLSFMTSNRATVGKSEAVETFYGRAMFGGDFAWLDNVKRPGLSAAFSSAEALPFDFSTSDAISDTFVNPGQNLELIASVSFLPNELGYSGPFDGGPGPDDLIVIEEVHPGMLYDDGDDHHHSSSGSSFNPNGNDDETPDDEENPDPDNTPVVPLPGSISLALIGLAVLSKFRKK